MPDFGLTTQGFNRKRLPDIREELRESFRDAFGSINVAPESAFGQIIGTLAEREDTLWQLAEAVYLAQYPDSAAGRSLDGVASLTGISRLPATRTRVTGVLIGDTGTNVPAGSQAENEEAGDLYETQQDNEIAPGSALTAAIEVTAQDSTTYTITVNGTDYSFTSTSEDADTIALELASTVDDDADVDATADGSTVELISTDRLTTFSVSLTGPLAFESVGSPGEFIAVETGERIVPAGSLTSIETPVSGWQDVNNLQDGEPGRDTETDAQLRVRREQSLRVIGAGTVEAIRARLLQNVDGVLSVSIIENRTDETDEDGRPPHSFESIVSGGEDQAVGDELWQVKPAGIETFGNVSVVVEDSQGTDQPIAFSRPVNVYIWVRMTVNINGVGTWPDNGPDAIREELVEYGDTLGVGDNVVFQALFGPIYQVPGVATVDLEIARTPAPDVEPEPGDWVTENITIEAVEQTLWDADRIEVTVNE